MLRFFVVLFSLVLVFVFSSCNHGLKPPSLPEQTGFGGVVFFRGEWPDTVFDLRVVAFRDYPPKNIIQDVLQGKAVFTKEKLPVNVSSARYSIFTEPGEWKYVVCAMQYGENIFSDWKVIGVYDETPDDTIPTPVVVPSGKFVTGIDIFCDFQNPPPQPFNIKNIGLIFNLK